MKHYITIILILLYSTIGMAQNGDNIFNDAVIHTIEINSIAPYTYEEFHDTLHASHIFWLSGGTGNINHWDPHEYYKASVTIDGVTLDTIGIRYKGGSTFENAQEKFSIKLDFNEYVKGQKYDGLKKLNLNNNLFTPTGIRSKLAYDIMDRMGVAAPRESFAKVYVNNSYRGIYSIVEQIDKTFVKSNFTPDSIGYLHKAYGLSFDYNTGAYTTYEDMRWAAPLKTKKNEDNYQPLQDFIITATNTPASNYQNVMDNEFDTDGFIKQTAVTMIIDDRDHYCWSAWNFYMYLDPDQNKWFMIPWDYDLSFSILPQITDPVTFGSNCYLTQRMIDEIPEYKNQYFQSLCDVINEGMDSTWVMNRIDELADLLRDEVEADPYNTLDGNSFDYYLENDFPGAIDPSRGLRPFINERIVQVRQRLSEEGFSCPDTPTGLQSMISDRAISVFPNPANDWLYLALPTDLAPETYLSVFDNYGRQVLIENNVTNTIDTKSLPAGSYNIRIVGKDFFYQSKFVKIE